MNENRDSNKAVENLGVTQDPKQISSRGTLGRGSYSDWLNVSGDVDDFIFYDNHKSVSDR